MTTLDSLTQAGRDLLNEHTSRSAHMVKHVRAVEQEASARTLARVAEAVRALPEDCHGEGACPDPTVTRFAVLALLEEMA